jgi:signal transduction histidine kinase
MPGKRAPSAPIDSVAGVIDILDSLHIGACLFDEEDRTLLWNGSFLRLFPEHDGFVAAGEPYAENLRRFYRVRLSPTEMGAIDQCIAEGIARHRAQTQPFVFEHRGRWVRVASKPLPGLGRMRIWTPIAAPDTPDAFPDQGDEGDGRSEVGPDGRIARCNSRFASLFGLVTTGAASGRTHAALVSAVWAKAGGAPAAVMQTLAEGERFAGVPFELALPEDRWLRVLQYRLADGRVVSSFADVTAAKRIQTELSAARENAERVNRAKDGLLAAVSHELRTPLNGILGVLSVLETRPLPQEAADQVGVALQSTHGLLHLVDDILSFSQRQGAMPIATIEAIDPAQLVRDVVQLLAPQARAKGIGIRAAIAGDLAGRVEVDAARLRQVLVNLAGNALKFTERGEVTVHLSQQGRTADGKAVLSFAVLDTGIGIPASAQQAIFLPHVQAGPEIAGRYGGSGLGLAICRTIVQGMGGEIAVASTEGEGSQFSFSLSCREVAPAPPPVLEALPTLPALRVLVVDDLAINREVARILLERLGQVVVLAGRDEDAFAALATPPDLLLLDLDMPGLGGIGLLAALRAAAPGRRIRAVALTGHTGEEHRRLCVEAGFDGFLTKPLSLRALAGMIVGVLRTE